MEKENGKSIPSISKKIENKVNGLIGWKEIESWKCIKCGTCCIDTEISFVPYEYTNFPKKYVKWENNIPYLRRGKLCPFQKDKLCTIHKQKPYLCRIYPFHIRWSYNSEIEKEKSEFVFNKFKLYVFIDGKCNGVNKGKAIKGIILDKVKDYLKNICILFHKDFEEITKE